MRTVEELKADIETYQNDTTFPHGYWNYEIKELNCELRTAITANIHLDRLEEICKAEKEGRLRVLSCKEGDYYIHSVIAEIKRLEDVKKNIEHLLQYEAAEAALKERM